MKVFPRFGRLNWLGDFGTQFGLLLHGLSESGQDVGGVLCSADDADAVRRLHAAYVAANERAESSGDFRTGAVELSAKLEESLEKGEGPWVEEWGKVRELTIRELEKTYFRLGISFDEYHGEAMYRDVVVTSHFDRSSCSPVLHTVL